jgi:hypothetical protein
VRFFVKSGGIVDTLAFEKDASDRVEGFSLIPLDDGMDVIDYGAIEVSLRRSSPPRFIGIGLPDCSISA